jgi:hypothetical protein
MKIHYFLIFLLFVACKPKDKPENGDARAVLPTENNDSSAQEAPKEDDNKKIELKANQILVKYESATVYAGMTDYFFKTADGKTLKISVTTIMDEASVKVPDNMLDDNPDLEGPPGAHPKQVGKQYIVSFDAKKQPIEIAPAE